MEPTDHEHIIVLTALQPVGAFGRVPNRHLVPLANVKKVGKKLIWTKDGVDYTLTQSEFSVMSTPYGEMAYVFTAVKD